MNMTGIPERLRKFISLLLSAVTSAAVVSASADMTVFAENVQQAFLPEDTRQVGYIDEDTSVNYSERRLYADNDGLSEKQFLGKCSGYRIGFEDMALRSKGTSRRKIYSELLEKSCNVWFSEDDIEPVESVIAKGYYRLFKIDCSELDVTQGISIESYFTFLNDNPVFYFLSSYIELYPNGSILVYTDKEYLNGKTRAACQAAIKDYLTKTAGLVETEDNEYDKALKFHDKLCDDMHYAYVANSHIPSDLYYHHSIMGGILFGSGVCESYAKLYQLMLNYCGVDNVYVTGTGSGGGHVWNMVRLDDGKFYDFDVTWDDLGYGKKYFARGSEFFDVEHIADTPENSNEEFLYALPEVSVRDHPGNGGGEGPGPSPYDESYDVNGDGIVNNRDIKALQLNIIYFGGEEKYDFNGDGKVNNRDIKELQKKIIASQSA